MFDIGFPRDWSSLKKLIWLKAISGGGGSSPVWKTVTGTLIHITDALASPMQKCEVTLEPIQDLHGQDAPYPAGGGKNILDPDERTKTSQNIYFYKNSGFLLKANQPYTFTVYSEENCAGLYVHEFPSNEYLKTAYNVKTTTYTPTEDVEVWFEAYYSPAPAQSTSEIKCQLELGSTSTPWSPFANICPITGWTGCEVYRTGVNVWDEEWELGGYYNATGLPWATNDRIRSKNYVPILPNTVYGVSLLSFNALCFYDVDKNFISGSATYANTFTTPSNARYLRFACGAGYGTTYQNDISINYPSTDTSYHPYSGTTLSVTFPNTVYGGSHEFVSGGLKSKMAKIVYDGSSDESWTRNAAKEFYIPLHSMVKSDNYYGKIVCDKLKTYRVASADIPNYGITGYTDSGYPNQNWLYVYLTGNETVEELRSFLSENPITVVYELATPLTYQLTPQQIATLKGENNVWGSGDLEITYKAQAS